MHQQQQQQQNSVSVPAADAPAVEVKHSSSVIASLAESAHSICLGYFGPTVFAVGITLLRFPYTTIPVADVSIGAVAIVFSIFNCGITYYACYREWTPAEMKQGIKGRIRRLSYQWSSFYEGARDLKTWYVRQHVFEDMLVAYVIAGLSAVYPQSIAGCTAMCGLMFLVSVAHLVYLLMVKPYESKLEGFLSVINAIIMVVIALLSTVTLINDTNTIETVLGVALLAANAFYFVQALILCGVAFIEMIRDKSKSKEEENKGLEGPLLMMVEPESQTTAHQAPSNPQAQPDYQAVPAQQQQSQPVVNPLAQGHY